MVRIFLRRVLLQVKQEQIISWVHRRGSAVRSLRLQGSYQSLDGQEMVDENGSPPDTSVGMATPQPAHDFTG